MDAYIGILKKYGLTTAEVLSILLELASRLPKYLIRAERHPDHPDRCGDVDYSEDDEAEKKKGA